MPDPPLDTRQESMKFVGATSFEGAPFSPNGGAPSRSGDAPSRCTSDSDDSCKAVVVEGDSDVSGGTDEELMNVTSSSCSSSSSSSSTVAETQDMHNNLASDSSSQYDDDEETTDVPETLPMSTRSLDMSEFYAHLDRRNQEPRLFEDFPGQRNTSSGLGNYESRQLMELPEEPQHDADPQQVQEPEEILPLSTTIVTFQVPGFSMGLAGGIAPFAEEQSVEDPDQVGLENLNIFLNP